MTDGYEAKLRVRAAVGDAHYAEGLVAGAWVLGLFGDLATELCIAHDGDEGLMRAYDSVEFLAPIRGGDFIEGRGWFVSVGRTSRRFRCEAWRVVQLDSERGGTSGRVLDEPILVASASGTVVVPSNEVLLRP